MTAARTPVRRQGRWSWPCTDHSTGGPDVPWGTDARCDLSPTLPRSLGIVESAAACHRMSSYDPILLSTVISLQSDTPCVSCGQRLGGRCGAARCSSRAPTLGGVAVGEPQATASPPGLVSDTVMRNHRFSGVRTCGTVQTQGTMTLSTIELGRHLHGDARQFLRGAARPMSCAQASGIRCRPTLELAYDIESRIGSAAAQLEPVVRR